VGKNQDSAPDTLAKHVNAWDPFYFLRDFQKIPETDFQKEFVYS
jgi:hypothetical protein